MPFSRETYLKAPGADEESETGVFEKPLKRYPLFIHCLSGKDRTGSVVAAILLVLGIGRDVIREEYLLSDGEVQASWIELALDGMGEGTEYFGRVDLEKVRRNLFEKNS